MGEDTEGAHGGQGLFLEAVLDLYLLAAVKDGSVTLNGKNYEVKRGQIITTTRYLVERWGWSKGGLDRFLRGAHFGAHFGAVSNSAFTCISVKNMSDDGETWGANWDTKRGATPILNKNVYLEEYNINVRAREESPSSPGNQSDGIDGDISMLRGSPSWLEQIMMRHKGTEPDLDVLFGEFAAECRCNGLERHVDINDAKRHFNNWLRIYIRQQRNQNGTKDRGHRPSASENIAAAQREELARTAALLRGSEGGD